MIKTSITYVLLIAMASATFTGCIGGSSQKSIFYVLSPSQEALVGEPRHNFKGLGVGTVKIPEYLKRPELVTRNETNVLIINDFHRWGGSLETQIVSLLVDNLSALLKTPNVSAYPWERHFSPAWQLYIDFRRLDGMTGGTVELEAVWRLVRTEDNATVFTQRSSLLEQTDQKGLKAYVKALNTAIEKLCRQIANETDPFLK